MSRNAQIVLGLILSNTFSLDANYELLKKQPMFVQFPLIHPCQACRNNINIEGAASKARGKGGAEALPQENVSRPRT